MSFLRRGGLLSASAMAIVICLLSIASADFTPHIQVQPGEGSAPAVLLVNNKPAIRFQVSNGGLSPTSRATITADRLRNLVAANTDWGSIGVRAGKSSVMVTAGESTICVVTKADAKANNTDPQSLASTWASKLTAFLQMPPLKLSDDELLIPLGESRTCQLSGAATGPVTILPGDPTVAACEVSTDTGAVKVTGKAVGDTVVVISREGERASIVAHVRKYAGHKKDAPAIEVTGEPAPSTLLKTLAKDMASDYVDCEPGAKVDFGEPKLAVNSLERGKSTVAAVPVTITGQDYIPTSFNAAVTLTNIPMLRKPVETLFYSNDPESVTKYGQLYLGKIMPDSPTRLLYHHQNRIGRRMRFEVCLINPSDVPARVQVISGVCAPMEDTVYVGYCAGSKFLRDYLSHVGYILTIPARARLVLLSQMVDPIGTASGIIEFREVQGNELLAKVSADLPENDIRKGAVLPASDVDFAASLSQQVYPWPVKKVDAKYVVGERWAFIGVGKNPITGVVPEQKLFGNYGVIYEVRIQMVNPTSLPQKVSVVFEPVAGLASAVFFIDGKFVEKKYVTPPNELTLATYTLGPNETREETVLTLPLSGSSYPANIVVKPIN